MSAASYLLSASWIIEIKIQTINKLFYVDEDQYLFKNPYVEDGYTRQQLSFSFPELWYGPLYN